MVGNESEELRARALDEDDEDEADNNPAEGMAEEFCGDAGHNPPTGHDACEGGGKQSAKSGPRCVFVEGADGKEIGEDKKGKDDAGGFAGGEDFGHEDDGEKSEGTEA